MSDNSIASDRDEVWYTRCPVPTAFGYGLENDVFAAPLRAAGVRWEPLLKSPDHATRASHFTHRKQRSIRHGGNVPALWARSRGADTRLVGLSWVRNRYPILTLPGSGIDTVADLRGRRLLVPVTDADFRVDFWQAVVLRVYDTALRTAGLTLDDVELVRTPPVPAPADYRHVGGTGQIAPRLLGNLALQRNTIVPLLRGEVDAVATQGQLGFELAALTGAATIFDQLDRDDPLEQVNNDAPDTLTFSADLCDDTPDVAALVVARILRAAAAARADAARTVSVLAHELELAPGLVEASFDAEIGDQLSLDFSDTALRALASQNHFLVEHGFLDAPVDLAAWIDRRPLERARDLLARDNAESAPLPLGADR